jgi:imidazolonepropionase-like amidohydrolase
VIVRWLLLAAVACGPVKHPQPTDIAIQCGALIDGVAPRAIPHATIIVRGGTIARVEPSYVDAGLRVVDLRDMTCLPGLIDLHTHLTDSPEDGADLTRFFRDPPGRRMEISRRNAEATLRAGFTTVRNVGTYVAWADRELRDAIERGEVVGPRMQICGFYLTIPHGGGDLFVPSEHPEPNAEDPKFHAGVARGAAQFRERANQAVAGGADVIKVIASGAVLAFGGVPGAPEMTFEELAAVVEVAHAARRRVAAHAHGAQSIKDAIRAGVDTIEHASLIDDEGIALAREHHVVLVMDIYNGDYIDTEGRKHGLPDEFLRKNLETTARQREAFTRAHAAGAVIAFGTDAAVFPHGDNARQFRYMVEHGMTAMEAIQSSTSVAADAMGWSDRVGRVAPGRFADVIAVAGDPLADIRLLESVQLVIKGGNLVRDREIGRRSPDH